MSNSKWRKDVQERARFAPLDHEGAETVLVERARKGDRDAFARLYKSHVNRIYALCLRMTAEAETAETLTQDAFVRAWQKLDKFEGRSRFGTWLHRLTINVILDHRRIKALRDSREQLGDPEDFAGTGSTSPIDSGGRIDLDRAIARLPTGARTIFVMHDVEGFLHREIAESMGLAVGTVKAQLHRARKLLREVLS